MRNVFIGWPDLTRAPYACTLSGGSWTAALPLANLKEPQLHRVARSNNLLTASTQFDADLGAAKLLRCVAVPRHNLSLTATWRLRLSTVSNFASTVIDTGWLDAWPAAHRPDTEEFARGHLMRPLLWLGASEATARYLRLEISDASNAAGYVDLARLFVARRYLFAVNPQWGAKIAAQPRSVVQQSLGGAKWTQRRRALRLATLQVEGMTIDEAFLRHFEINSGADVTEQVFFAMDADDAANLHASAFLGTLKTLDGVTFQPVMRGRVQFQIEEA